MSQHYHALHIYLNIPENFLPKAEYVFRIYCRIIGLQPIFHYRFTAGEIHVYYGPGSNLRFPIEIRTSSNGNELLARMEPVPHNQFNFVQFQGESIPFVFGLPGPIYRYSHNRIIIGKDIVASAYYFLNMIQESAFQHTPSDRFPYEKSSQAFWDFADIPVVDRYCSIFSYALDLILPLSFRKPRWPDNRDYAVTLSHDLDWWRYWNRDALKEINSYNWKRFPRRPVSALYKLFLHNTVSRFTVREPSRVKHVLSREQSWGISSTNFLRASAKEEDQRKKYLFDYSSSKEIKKILPPASSLHGSPKAAFDAAILEQEIANLRTSGFSGSGFRSHTLALSPWKTFQLLGEAGFHYDASVGFWEHTGFRAGISFPFYPFDPERNLPQRIMEIPLSVMDVTLYSEKAMNLGAGRAFRHVRRMLDQARKTGGHISLLWHFRTFDWVDYPLWGSLMWRILRYAARTNAWICSLDQMYRHWSER